MNIIYTALPTALVGEPTAAALHREALHNEKSSSRPAKVVDHRARQRVRMLRAGVTTRVGTYFS
jgi:hypothetical protein